MTEREENNKALAEWVGFRYVEDSEAGTPQWHSPECKCEAIASQDECTCIEACYWVEGGPPDFYTDEPANAMLLEKMPNPLLGRWEASGNSPETWACSPDRYQFAGKLDPDRKAAVCAAALLIARPA